MKTSKIISIVAVIVLAVIAFWFYSNKNQGDATNMGLQSAGLDVKSAQTYTSATYNFSFKYPTGLKVSEFASPDGVGDVVLVSDAQTGVGMQVYITSFDEPADNLTVDRVKSSLPDLTLIDPAVLVVGTSGKGVSFRDGATADSKVQDWFVSGGHLYQVSAPVSFADTLKGVLATWEFK